MKDLHQKTINQEDARDAEQTAESRRKFLKQAGKFALYTPPAVMVLMKPSFAGNKGSWAGRPNCSWKGQAPRSWDGQKVSRTRETFRSRVSSNKSWKSSKR